MTALYFSSCFKKESTVASFDPVENVWNEVGNLQVARNYHAVVELNDNFWVIGGDDGEEFERSNLYGAVGLPIESCNRSLSCRAVSPIIRLSCYCCSMTF